MLLNAHKGLIKVLITKTEDGTFTWTKAKSRLGYETNPRGNRFLIDKYFASANGSESAGCLNLSIFESEVLVAEIVLCNAFDDQKADYALLNELYTKVEELQLGVKKDSEIPLINSITQSLQA
jgi:hypothetical protein